MSVFSAASAPGAAIAHVDAREESCNAVLTDTHVPSGTILFPILARSARVQGRAEFGDHFSEMARRRARISRCDQCYFCIGDRRKAVTFLEDAMIGEDRNLSMLTPRPTETAA